MDIIHDIHSIPDGTRGKDIDLFKPSTGFTEHGRVSGPIIAENILKYMADRSSENYNNVLTPLSAPIPYKPRGTKSPGVGRIDVARLIPEWLS